MSLLCLSIVDKPLLCSSIVHMQYAIVVFISSRCRTNNKAAWSSHGVLFTVCLQCHFFSRLRFYPLTQFSFLALKFIILIYKFVVFRPWSTSLPLVDLWIMIPFYFDGSGIVTCYAHLNVVQLWYTGIWDSFLFFFFLLLTISIELRSTYVHLWARTNSNAA
jgi:hypothetical protein